ncbi:hypothetical protein GCM10023074_16900 [Microbispora amethystogenes]|uniref:FtsX extracellular domain-containing protein n=1 Tax=Microbispora amethystogenes TaxID=1427754 RepID=A0ABQ4F6Y5_9ACTN|nr:hypothetical protein Mam01_07510 [Microbispora amethystogenes]
MFLCVPADVFPACKGRGAATAREIRRVRALLTTAPEVGRIEFVSRADELRVERKMFKNRPDLLETLELEDMRQQYSVRIGPGDWPALVRRMSASPGVSNALVIRDDYWPGKADVMIQLCPQEWPFEGLGLGDPCEGRGWATLAEKNAVLDRVDDLPGLERVYFQARSHQAPMWHRRHVPDSDPVPGSEFFYLKFATPPVLSEVKRALRGAAGVFQVGAVDVTTKGNRL